MKELLTNLHMLRLSLDEISTDRKAMQAEFEKSDSFVNCKAVEAKLKERVEAAEAAVRQAAIVKYQEDKIKTNPGYVVSETTEAEIKDAANLREWVIKNAMIMMVVDTKQVMSVATSDNNTIPAELVEVKKIEKVKISTKLGDVIAE